MLSSPKEAAGLMLKKLYLFWAGIERSNNKYMQFFWKKFGFGKFPLPGFWLIGPAALLGGVLLWPRRRKLSLLYLFVLSYMVGVVVFFVNGRFRLPVVPVLIILAAYAVFHLIYASRAKGTGFLRIIAILAVCVFIVDYDYISFRGVRALDEAVTYYELGNAHMNLGNKESARIEFENAWAVQKKYPTRGYLNFAGTIDYNLGLIYWEKGAYPQAIEALKRVSDRYPKALQAKVMLADCYAKMGLSKEAIRTYEAILRRDPNDKQSLLGLARLYRELGDVEKATQFLTRLRDLYPNNQTIQKEIDALGAD
jgi:tetratricopeptide (TPR) repeat protein